MKTCIHKGQAYCCCQQKLDSIPVTPQNYQNDRNDQQNIQFKEEDFEWFYEYRDHIFCKPCQDETKLNVYSKSNFDYVKGVDKTISKKSIKRTKINHLQTPAHILNVKSFLKKNEKEKDEDIDKVKKYTDNLMRAGLFNSCHYGSYREYSDLCVFVDLILKAIDPTLVSPLGNRAHSHSMAPHVQIAIYEAIQEEKKKKSSHQKKMY